MPLPVRPPAAAEVADTAVAAVIPAAATAVGTRPAGQGTYLHPLPDIPQAARLVHRTATRPTLRKLLRQLPEPRQPREPSNRSLLPLRRPPNAAPPPKLRSLTWPRTAGTLCRLRQLPVPLLSHTLR